MQKILAFNTILSNLNIILQNSLSVIKTNIIESKKQSEILVSSIESMLSANKLWYNDIDIFASITGPGNFTSIKTNLAVLKALQISTNKKIITNNMFEIISFEQNQCDIIILDLNNAKYYIKDKNSYYIIYKTDIKSFLEENKNATILTNDHGIVCDNIILSNFSIEKWAKLNCYKAQNQLFTNEIEPLYIEEAKITKRK